MKKEICIIVSVILMSLLLWWILGNKMYEGLQNNAAQNNAAQNNEQILNDIQNLQQLEKEVFNNLETNSNLSSTEQQKLVSKINDLSNMRINLYKTIYGVNGFFNSALSSSLTICLIFSKTFKPKGR